jgi:hypothetical protein
VPPSGRTGKRVILMKDKRPIDWKMVSEIIHTWRETPVWMAVELHYKMVEAKTKLELARAIESAKPARMKLEESSERSAERARRFLSE